MDARGGTFLTISHNEPLASRRPVVLPLNFWHLRSFEAIAINLALATATQILMLACFSDLRHINFLGQNVHLSSSISFPLTGVIGMRKMSVQITCQWFGFQFI